MKAVAKVVKSQAAPTYRDNDIARENDEDSSN